MVCILLGPHPFELLLDWHLILEFDALVHCEGSHRVSAIWMRHWAYSRALGTNLVFLLSSFVAFKIIIYYKRKRPQNFLLYFSTKMALLGSLMNFLSQIMKTGPFILLLYKEFF